MALCDLAFRFESVLNSVDVDGTQTVSYLQILESLLTSCNSSLLYVAAECIAKLHSIGRVHDSNLLAHLLIIYFGYDSKDSGVGEIDVSIGSPLRLEQLLTVFFPIYGSHNGKDALINSSTVVENLVNQRSMKKTKKSSLFPLPKVLQFIQTCTESNNDE